MYRKLLMVMVLLSLLTLSGCGSKSDNKTNDKDTNNNPSALSFDYDFEQNMHGWTSGFSGISEHYLSKGYDMNFTHGDYTYMDTTNKGIYLAGNNLESNLFMYTMKKFGQSDGLSPLTKYAINLRFDAISTMPTHIDDAPENQIYVKAGIVNVLPEPDLTADGNNNFYRVNLDKGDPATDGKDLSTLGSMAIGSGNDQIYGQKAFEKTFYVQTNNLGELWVVIGTDTSRDGSSSIYIDNVHVDFSINE